MRSGRDWPAAPKTLPEALDGLSAGVEEGSPRKSRPSNESPCFACGLDEGGALGGVSREAGSVVLGLAGGVGTSPRISILGGGFGIGAGG